ncbi:D-glycerate dehydrogenase [Candidatus Kaiserbacteria bacterium]|nr:D-glycerate dehydrogenase [Candidatus Kaiserbacteria bacterium]
MKIFITRAIPEAGLDLLRASGHDIVISGKDGVLTKGELIAALKAHNPDAVVCLLTDKIDADVFAAASNAKIFANYAVGFDNIDLKVAAEKGITITNTPGVLTDSVAEHAVALIFAVTKRIAESDRFTRAGKYVGWAPMLLLGSDLKGKTLGILGGGRIGSRVLEIMGKGVGMRCLYYDIKRSEELEKATGAEFRASIEEVLREADVVSIHVPLLDSTRHLMNAERFAMMKKSAYLINTSRGQVIDEAALVTALRNGIIRGAALDVYENEPALADGLAELDNVVLTPHTASATDETRSAMSEIAAKNIIAFLKGETPPNVVKSA